MSRFLSGILIILLILSSCQNKKNPAITEIDIHGHPMKVIDYKAIKDSSNLNLSDFAGDFEYIPLETTEECLISHATYYVYEQYILVFQRAKSVLQFSRDGKFLRSICSHGKGP